MKIVGFAVAGAAMTMGVSALASSNGASFLDKAIQGDNSEMALGQLGAQRGTSAGTRAFGHMLFSDHSKGKAQAAAVARRLGVPVPNQMTPEAVAERTKLEGLHGYAFDHEFARYMVDDHRKDIADFNKEMTSNDPRPVIALARQTLPVLHHHLATAERLSR